MKSEPEEYGIDDLARDKRDWWTGVRNYQARNFMKNDMKKGDGVLFYHSSCKAPGVYGVAQVCAAAVPDPEQFVPDGDYYDPAASEKSPRWFCVRIAFVRKLAAPFFIASIAPPFGASWHGDFTARQSSFHYAGNAGGMERHYR